MKNTQEKIRYLGHEYEIERVDDFQYLTGNPARLSEFYLKIYVDNSLPESNQGVCIAHELVEAINHHNELDLPHQTMTVLGESFYQLLKYNDLKKILKL